MTLEIKLKEAESLRQEIEVTQWRLAVVELEIALKASPYSPGDRIRTNRGLGQQGLVVHAVLAPAYPSANNRWATQTWVLSKTGETTKRSVILSENDVALCGYVITKE